ncbi:hypothetical protein EVAR_69631_1 [Eumeta japonica]|uniref:Uncharacterized protein n=1 Tax=Eumeta variegata TaxID=151549 RepID=A0A4C2AHN1_EUMVA|nr:hypothetical protein EVAR_69631_1 [Eumeta japonica]
MLQITSTKSTDFFGWQLCTLIGSFRKIIIILCSRGSGTVATSTGSNSYLAPSSFIRFATDASKSQSHHHHHLNTHPQFPPPPDLELENDVTTSINTPSNSTNTLVYKPVRLEPSSLDQLTHTGSHNANGGTTGCGSNGIYA